MTWTRRGWIGLALAGALLLPAQLSAGDRVLLEQPLSKTVCPNKNLKVPGGFDKYIWYGGPDVDEIELDANEDPFVGGAPLQSIDSTTDPELAESRFKGRSVVYLRKMLGTTGSFKSRYTKIKITHAKSPKITIEAAEEVDRGEEVELKTKEEFKKYRWWYLGIPARAERAKSSYANNPDGWRCVEIKDGKIKDCDATVWTGGTQVTEEMHFLQVKARRRPIDKHLDDKKTAFHHPLFNSALYGVEVSDSNGCAGSKLAEVEVDQHSLDLIAGVDFARATGQQEPAESGDAAATTATEAMEPMTTDPDPMDDSGDLFANSAGFAGVRWRQYVSSFLGVYGDTRFGGSNVEAKGAGTAPNTVLLQADTFQADFGLFYDLGCSYGSQVCFYGKAELGVILPEDDFALQPPAAGDDATEIPPDPAARVDNQLLRTFVGAGWRYHKPNSIFHRTYTEIGFGRSENFLDSTGRWKLRAEAFFDLTNTWDIFLRGEIDNDGGSGPDDLRVVFGASRDLAFLGDVLVNVLGLGEKKKDDKK